LRSLAAAACAAASLCSVAPAFAGELTHQVVAGDTLWSLAARYHVSVSQLEARNHLTGASILQLGQFVVVGTAARPSSARPSSTRPSSAGPSLAGPSLPGRCSTPNEVRRCTARRSSHHASRQLETSVPTAARNAVWVATHTGRAPAPPAPLSIALAERILELDAKVTHTALRYIGVPYAWGGTSYSGVDCSGFVQAVFEHNGIDLPRTADGQFDTGRPVRSADLEPGDLVFFQTYAPGASHVGIYLGSGRFVHASSSDGVRVDALATEYYAERYIGARRLIR